MHILRLCRLVHAYLGVLANPRKYAVSFMGILICALFRFNISPMFFLFHTISAMAIFMVITILVKPIDCSIMDIDFFKRYNDHYGHPMNVCAIKARLSAALMKA